jgi:hypothetical protein
MILYILYIYYYYIDYTKIYFFFQNKDIYVFPSNSIFNIGLLFLLYQYIYMNYEVIHIEYICIYLKFIEIFKIF